MYDLTSQFATLEPPPPPMVTLLAAIEGNQASMDDFVSVIAGTMSPLEFFSEQNVGRMLALATEREAPAEKILAETVKAG